jgi:hypothetical protein
MLVFRAPPLKVGAVCPSKTLIYGHRASRDVPVPPGCVRTGHQGEYLNSGGQKYSGRKVTASFTDRYRYTRGRQERPKDDSTKGEKTQSSPCIIRCETVTFRLQKYRNGGQPWAVNVFNYAIHAQTDCWASPPLALSIFSTSYPDVSQALSYFVSTVTGGWRKLHNEELNNL